MQGHIESTPQETPIPPAAPATKKETPQPMGFRPETTEIRRLIETQAAETGKTNSRIINEWIAKGISAEKDTATLQQKLANAAQKLSEAQARINQMAIELDSLRQTPQAITTKSPMEIVKHCFERAQSYGYFGSLKHLQTGLNF